MIAYRDYQIQCHDSILDKWKDHTSTLAVLATGLGKTVIFSNVIQTMQPKRALVLAHREELIYQARDKIQACTKLQCGIEMADLRVGRDLFHTNPVIIATVQTMVSGSVARRMTKFRPTDFGLLVVDECHHSTSPSYRSIINYFKQNPDIKILGVTATPDRHDEEALGQVFESVAFDYGILEGVENGWLVSVTQQFCSVSTLDFSHVRTTAGDLNGSDLAEVMEAEQNIQGVCHPSLEVLYGLKPQTLTTIPVPEWTQYLKSLDRKPRRAIVFTASVKQAEACCNILNRAVPGLSEWVCGATNNEQRQNILHRFSTGQTAVVVNCGVLTEGFDNPAVEVILMARPTKSRALYAQMIGRSTRTLPGVVDGWPTKEERLAQIKSSAKPYTRVIDFVGNSGNHKLITCFDILGGRVSEAAAARAQSALRSKGNVVNVCRALTKEESQIQKERKDAAERARVEQEARKHQLIAKVRFQHREVNPFNKWAKGYSPDSTKMWRGKGPSALSLSAKQQRILRKAEVDPAAISAGYGRVLIPQILKKWFGANYKDRMIVNGTNEHTRTDGAVNQ